MPQGGAATMMVACPAGLLFRGGLSTCCEGESRSRVVMNEVLNEEKSIVESL